MIVKIVGLAIGIMLLAFGLYYLPHDDVFGGRRITLRHENLWRHE